MKFISQTTNFSCSNRINQIPTDCTRTIIGPSRSLHSSSSDSVVKGDVVALPQRPDLVLDVLAALDLHLERLAVLDLHLSLQLLERFPGICNVRSRNLRGHSLRPEPAAEPGRPRPHKGRSRRGGRHLGGPHRRGYERPLLVAAAAVEPRGGLPAAAGVPAALGAAGVLELEQVLLMLLLLQKVLLEEEGLLLLLMYVLLLVLVQDGVVRVYLIVDVAVRRDSAVHVLVLLMLELMLLVQLLLLHSSLQCVGQVEELGLHRHAVARAVHMALLRRRHHHVEVVHELRGVRVQRDVRSAARGRALLRGSRHLPHRAALELLGREDVLGLGLKDRVNVGE